jgi:activating signal cointegrator 1
VHALIGNCLKCGKIVCEQEGAGPCLFCIDMLERKEAGMVASGTGTFSDTEAARQAAAHKDKLLEYGRTAAVRTQVFGMHARTICV